MLALWLCQPCSDLDFKGVGKKKEMHDGIFREKYLIKWEWKCWFSTNQALAEMGESSSERWKNKRLFSNKTCTLLFYIKENLKFSEVTLEAVHCNYLVGCIIIPRGYWPWNNINTTTDIYLFDENDNTITETRCKVCSKLLTSILLE